MKIGIDLKPFSTGSKYRGIGCFARGLIAELLKIDDRDLEFHFLNLYQPYQGDPELNENCRLYQYPMGPQIMEAGEKQLFRDTRTKDVIEGAVRHFLEQSQVDVMIFPSPNEYGNLYQAEWFHDVYTVGIVHDLIPLLFPDQFLYDELYKKDYFQSLEFIKGLDLLLTNSQTTKDDVMKLLHIPEKKVSVIYGGIDQDYKILEKVNLKKIKEKYHISDSFIMFAGGIDFKKNIEMMILAYAKCGKDITERYQFVIVGKISQDEIDRYLLLARDNGIEGRLVCTGFIPKTDLIELYNVTSLVVFPSLYEGFGLPVMEAMACGARVLTSNTSSLKEIAKGHATLVSPTSLKSITKGIRYIIQNPVATLKMADESVTYAETFNWKSSAERTINAIVQNYVQRKKESYSFDITEKMVKNIADVYADAGIWLDEKQQEEIADELVKIQDHEMAGVYDLQHRLLFDVTVVHEWLKAGYITGIARVSRELYYEFKKHMQVTPVIVENIKGALQCSEISMDDYKIIRKNIELKKNDIFFMPEIQMRGIHVPQKHPYAKEFQKAGIKVYAVIHDILPLTMPKYFEEKTAKGFHAYVKEILENYNGIICVSKCVADDVIRYYKKHALVPADKVKIGYFHHGQDTFYEQQDETVSYAIQQFFETDQRIYLMLGTVEPRKGHQLVLDAFETMWKNGSRSKLCIVGHVGWNMEKFITRIKEHPQAGSKLAFFEGVKDSEVKYAYQHAQCLIQASAGEGFGLPLIEAGRYHLPILCSDIEVFHEVAGEHANYFKRNKDDLIKKMTEFENGKAVYDSQKIAGKSWREAADRIYSMMISDQDWYQIIG